MQEEAPNMRCIPAGLQSNVHSGAGHSGGWSVCRGSFRVQVRAPARTGWFAKAPLVNTCMCSTAWQLQHCL